MSFVFIFILVFKRAFDALFSNDYNRQTIHKQFCFIFILNRRDDVNFILRLDLFSLRFLRNFNRNVNCFFEKLILDSGTLCLENIKQFLILDFSEIESSFCCLRFLLKLNQEISKSSHFRVDDVRAMMCDMINRNNHVASATSLFDFFTHTNDMTNVFYQRIHKNIVVIIFFDDRGHLIVHAHNSALNHTKSSRNFDRHQFAFARQRLNNL